MCFSPRPVRTPGTRGHVGLGADPEGPSLGSPNGAGRRALGTRSFGDTTPGQGWHQTHPTMGGTHQCHPLQHPIPGTNQTCVFPAPSGDGNAGEKGHNSQQAGDHDPDVSPSPQLHHPRGTDPSPAPKGHGAQRDPQSLLPLPPPAAVNPPVLEAVSPVADAGIGECRGAEQKSQLCSQNQKKIPENKPSKAEK